MSLLGTCIRYHGKICIWVDHVLFVAPIEQNSQSSTSIQTLKLTCADSIAYITDALNV